jgi:hypothetical protein
VKTGAADACGHAASTPKITTRASRRDTAGCSHERRSRLDVCPVGPTDVEKVT